MTAQAFKISKTDERLNYIDDMDFDKLQIRLTDSTKSSDIDPVMDVELCEQLLFKYRCFLKLRVLYPKVRLYPSFGIDVIWHYHILDTKSYMKDCDYLFDEYLHHVPDFSAFEEFDENNAVDPTRMDELFQKHFNLPINTEHKGMIF